MHSDVTSLSKASIWQEASRVINEEGFRAFWKGNLVTIAHRLPYSSLSFFAYERYKSFLQPVFGVEKSQREWDCRCCRALYRRWDGRNNSCICHISTGSCEDVHSSTDAVASETCRETQCTIEAFGMHFIPYAEKKVSSANKGLGATLLGVGPSIAISFSVYESLRSFWHSKRPNDSTVMVSLACGSLSGIASSTATFPLDLVRRQMQLEGPGGRAPVYTSGLFGTFANIIRTEGF